MKSGRKVKTKAEWNEKYWPDGLTGTIRQVTLQGTMPRYPSRNHFIEIDMDGLEDTLWAKTGGHVWFDPRDLEYVDGQ